MVRAGRQPDDQYYCEAGTLTHGAVYLFGQLTVMVIPVMLIETDESCGLRDVRTGGARLDRGRP
jgi:hypothetical protein